MVVPISGVGWFVFN